MNQIAIGDGTASGGWLVLDGEGVSAPFRRVDYRLAYVPGAEVQESLILYLEGTPAELAAGTAALEGIRLRIVLYHHGGHPAPQCLRFQMSQRGDYAYTLIKALGIEANPDAVETRMTGSLLITLHLTRPNHFDSDLVELPLSGHDFEDVLGGVELYNHTDIHSNHGNSVWIKPANFDSDLPASLRLELTNTTQTGELRNIYLGIFHSPEEPDEALLFCYGGDFIGGQLYNNAAAINGINARVSWADTGWTFLGSWLLQNIAVGRLAGMSYRPILRFFNPHSYDDLHLKIKLQAGSNVLWEGESVYVDPVFGYILFPSVLIPPNRLLNETLPHHIDLVLYGQHDTAGTYTLDFDCLTLLPLEPGANFLAFYSLYENACLIDDNFLGLLGSHFSQVGSETVAHVRQGGELTLHPDRYHRLVLLMTDGDHKMDISRTARLQVFYRKRRRIL